MIRADSSPADYYPYFPLCELPSRPQVLRQSPSGHVLVDHVAEPVLYIEHRPAFRTMKC